MASSSDGMTKSDMAYAVVTIAMAFSRARDVRPERRDLFEAARATVVGGVVWWSVLEEADEDESPAAPVLTALGVAGATWLMRGWNQRWENWLDRKLEDIGLTRPRFALAVLGGGVAVASGILARKAAEAAAAKETAEEQEGS